MARGPGCAASDWRDGVPTLGTLQEDLPNPLARSLGQLQASAVDAAHVGGYSLRERRKFERPSPRFFLGEPSDGVADQGRAAASGPPGEPSKGSLGVAVETNTDEHGHAPMLCNTRIVIHIAYVVNVQWAAGAAGHRPSGPTTSTSPSSGSDGERPHHVVVLMLDDVAVVDVVEDTGTLSQSRGRSTLSNMKNAITIRLDPDLEKLLERFCRQTGRTRSDLVRDALRRQLSLLRFERLRRQALPFAEARGYLTDEDVVRDIS